jgi:HEAT repeat protein
MDNVVASFIAGAIVALISGSLALIASNYKEFQRRWDAHRTKATVRRALGVLENATVEGYPDHKTTQAVSDITQKSKEEGYPACFDWEDRERIVRVLGEKGGVQAVDVLKRALKDKDVDVRIAAVIALDNIHDVTVVPALVQALRDVSPYIRRKAATALGNIRSTKLEDIDPIIQVLHDIDPNVRRAAAEALGDIRNIATGQSTAMLTQATSYLVRTLKDEEWYVRREAAQALGKIKNGDAIPYLIRAYKEDDPDVRTAALTALAQFNDPRVADADVLPQALDDEDYVVRTTVLDIRDQALYPSIVRIKRNSEVVSGLGFLVDDTHIVTCAYVVKDALNLDDFPRETPSDTVKVDFPFVTDELQSTAHVRIWHPWTSDEDKISDIAVLELDNRRPEAAHPARLAPSAQFFNDTFWAFGIAPRYPSGIWSRGTIRERLPNGRLQVETLHDGAPIEMGFGGTPVWDEKLNGVVGVIESVLMTRTEGGDIVGGGIAFVIPIDVLVEVWPDLEKIIERDQKRL